MFYWNTNILRLIYFYTCFLIYIKGSGTGRGGWCGGGRKKGVKIKPETVVFYKRVTSEEKEKLEQYLNELRKQ